MLLITQSRVVNEHRVNVGPQQVSAVGHSQRLSASYGKSRFLALQKEGSESEVGNVKFLKNCLLPVKSGVVARFDKRGTSVVGAGLNVHELMAQ